MIKSIIFDTAGSLPPKNNPLIELDAAPKFLLATVKLPKSIALPVDAMVTYSITSLCTGVAKPPADIPRVDEEHAALAVVPPDVSPKLDAFDPVEMVTNSIVFVEEPATNNPR